MKNDTLSRRVTKLNGTVTSDKMEKTIVVSVARKMRHPLYKKIIVKTKKYKAHNDMDAKTGDKVQIEETKPMSKDKRFTVVKIYEKAAQNVPVFEEPSDLELLLGHEEKEEKVQETAPTEEEGAEK